MQSAKVNGEKEIGGSTTITAVACRQGQGEDKGKGGQEQGNNDIMLLL